MLCLRLRQWLVPWISSGHEILLFTYPTNDMGIVMLNLTVDKLVPVKQFYNVN